MSMKDSEFESYIYYDYFWLMDFYVSYSAKKYKRAVNSLLKEIKIQQKILSMPVINKLKKVEGIPGKKGPGIYVEIGKITREFSLSCFLEKVSTIGIGVYSLLKYKSIEPYSIQLLEEFWKLKKICLQVFKKYSVNQEILSFYRWAKKQRDPYQIECDYASIDPRLANLLSDFLPLREFEVQNRLDIQLMAYDAMYFKRYYLKFADILWRKKDARGCLANLKKEIQIQCEILVMPFNDFDEKKIIFPNGQSGGFMKPQFVMPEVMAGIENFLSEAKKTINGEDFYESVCRRLAWLKKQYAYYELQIKGDGPISELRGE